MNLLVQENTEEGIVDLNLAIVLDEAQFPPDNGLQHLRNLYKSGQRAGANNF